MNDPKVRIQNLHNYFKFDVRLYFRRRSGVASPRPSGGARQYPRNGYFLVSLNFGSSDISRDRDRNAKFKMCSKRHIYSTRKYPLRRYCLAPPGRRKRITMTRENTPAAEYSPVVTGYGYGRTYGRTYGQRDVAVEILF